MSTSPSFEKIAECLYRNPSSRAYCALVKVKVKGKGKQHKRSLKTTDLREESDCWEQAGVLAALARECFAEAELAAPSHELSMHRF